MSIVVVIVTWNKQREVLRLLDSLTRLEFPQDRISTVVVDNASSDGSVESIRAQYPHVTVLEHRENLGGAAGFNAGMRWALEHHPSCTHLWLLDDDALVTPGALCALVRALDDDAGAAACGSRIVEEGERGELVEVGAFLDFDEGGTRQNRPRVEPDAGVVHSVDYVAACSLLARASAVRDVGLWNDELFIYWDDMEWGARFRARGYRVLASEASVVHHPAWAGRVADGSAVWRTYYRTRNSLWFFNNYCPQKRRRRLILRMVARSVRGAVLASLSSERGIAGALLLGVRDFLQDRYGRRDLGDPSGDLKDFLNRPGPTRVALFLRDPSESGAARALVSLLRSSDPSIQFVAIVPHGERDTWRDHLETSEVVALPADRAGLLDRLRVFLFLVRRRWAAVVSTPPSPRVAALSGRPGIRFDASSGELRSIERQSPLDALRIAAQGALLLARAGLSLPPAAWSRELETRSLATGSDDLAPSARTEP